MKKTARLKGKEGFLDYYRKLHKKPEPATSKEEKDFNEWLNTLVKPNPPVLRFNPKYEKKCAALWKKNKWEWKTLSWYPHALQWPTKLPLETQIPGEEQGWFYRQNASSLIPVLALDPQPGEVILDACAAPGGKTVFIAERMKNKGTLIANDLSLSRRQRLKQVLKTYQLEDFATMCGVHGGVLFQKYPTGFDKILLDAPCSSEKHVYTNEKYLNQWSYKRIQELKKQQFFLLKRLWYALRPGGRLVYSTCAITPEENEGVITLFLKKFGGDATWKTPSKKFPGNKGRIELSRETSYDPMFVAILEKKR